MKVENTPQRALSHAVDLGHFSMQVAVSDRRQQFDGWNVGFINFIGLFDLVFHSRCI